MTENIKKIIEEKLTIIKLPNKKKLIEEEIIEGISYKDGHIQISLFANKDNIEEIEFVGKLIKKELQNIEGVISVTTVLTNEPNKRETNDRTEDRAGGRRKDRKTTGKKAGGQTGKSYG